MKYSELFFSIGVVYCAFSAWAIKFKLSKHFDMMNNLFLHNSFSDNMGNIKQLCVKLNQQPENFPRHVNFHKTREKMYVSSALNFRTYN